MVTVSMITLSVKYYCFCVLNYVRDIPIVSLILCDITEFIYSEWPNAKLKIYYISANQTIYYHYLRAYDIPRVGRISTTYPGSGAV